MNIQRMIQILVLLALISTGSLANSSEKSYTGRNSYKDLVSFFKEWRQFQKPKMNNNVPDYTAPAMAEQKRRIPEFRKKLAAIDISNWTIDQKVDYEIIRAEINGLEFDHQVLRPWARNPIFYSVIQMYEADVPAREVPEIYGVLNVFKHKFPLNKKSQQVFAQKLAAIPAVLAQARRNLVEEAGDYFMFGSALKRRESAWLTALASRMQKGNPKLVKLTLKAKKAVDEFTAWLDQKRKGMKPYSGIGIKEFNRYMKEVHLVPYDWHEQMALLERELERSLAALALEEHRNRHLPHLQPARSLQEMQLKYKTSVAHFMNFLKKKEIFTVPAYMKLDDTVDSFIPEEKLDFFTHINYRQPLPLVCHMVHWLEKQRELRNTHPIRGQALLYKIWDSRAEGLATGFEELMMQAGLMADHPRARELTHIMLAFRAIRAIGGLKLHSGDWTLNQAIAFGVLKTPRGYVKPNSGTLYGDYALYLSQPGYGTSYVIGKLQLDKLIADRARQLGKRFNLREFFDDYFSRGVIPASLLRWEMTGLDDEMKKLWK